jgi:hypothetical protein
VVERDFARIRSAFSGWSAVPFTTVCPDTAGGSATAEAEAAYRYPAADSNPADQVFIRVSYRSPANAHREVAGFATPAQLRCRKAALEGEHIPNTNPRKGPLYSFPTVRLAPGVPSWLPRLLGRHLQGYREVFIPPFGYPRYYDLVFIYADPRNPHITYTAAMEVPSPTELRRLGSWPQVDQTQEQDVLRLIHAIR